MCFYHLHQKHKWTYDHFVATNEPNETKVSRSAEDDIDTNRRGVYVTDATWRAAKSYAASQGISTSQLFEIAVNTYIEEKNATKPSETARSLINSLRKDATTDK